MDKIKKAKELFNGAFNCSQAVIGVFEKETQMNEETLLKLATSFGGGMREGEVCGAVTGALMALGLIKGHGVEEDLKSKEEAYALTIEFNKRFKEKHGAIRCKELLGKDISNEKEFMELKEEGTLKQKCPNYVSSAVEILQELIKEKA